MLYCAMHILQIQLQTAALHWPGYCANTRISAKAGDQHSLLVRMDVSEQFPWQRHIAGFNGYAAQAELMVGNIPDGPIQTTQFQSVILLRLTACTDIPAWDELLERITE